MVPRGFCCKEEIQAARLLKGRSQHSNVGGKAGQVYFFSPGDNLKNQKTCVSSAGNTATGKYINLSYPCIPLTKTIPALSFPRAQGCPSSVGRVQGHPREGSAPSRAGCKGAEETNPRGTQPWMCREARTTPGKICTLHLPQLWRLLCFRAAFVVCSVPAGVSGLAGPGRATGKAGMLTHIRPASTYAKICC